MNDITDIVTDAKLKLFADDVKIYAEVARDGRNVIQNNLSAIASWASYWQLKLASQKCVVLAIGDCVNDRNYFISGENLSSVSSFRDLGITVHTNLKVSSHVSEITKKAMHRIGMLFRAFKSRDVHTLLKGYKTYVRPVVESCTVVWNPGGLGDIRRLERIQRHFTYRLFKRCSRDYLPYNERCEVLGLSSLELRRLHFDLCMCYNIVHGAVDLKFHDFFREADFTGRGHQFKLAKNYCRTEVRANFFSNRVISAWNSLSE